MADQDPRAQDHRASRRRESGEGMELVCVGPYDSGAWLEFVELSGAVQVDGGTGPATSRREALLRTAVRILEENCGAGHRVELERFVRRLPQPGGGYMEAFDAEAQKKWARGTTGFADTLIFDQEGGPSEGRGSIVRISSSWTGTIERLSALPEGTDGQRLGAALERLEVAGVIGAQISDLKLDLFRHGIGVFSVRVRLEGLDVDETSLELMESVMGAVVLHPELGDEVRRIDSLLTRAFAGAVQKIGPRARVIEPCSGRQVLIGRPRWANAVLIHADGANPDAEMPLGRLTSAFVRAPEVPEEWNVCGHRPGFVHIGWGRSIMLGLTDRDLRLALDSLRRLQADWRTLEALGEDLRSMLGGLVDLQERSRRDMRAALWEVERVQLEWELLRASHERYLAMLTPFAHAVYSQGEAAWRMSEMKEGCSQVIRSLALLERGWIQRKESRDSRFLNRGVAVISVITLTSICADGASFLFGSESVKALGPWVRAEILVAPMLVVLGLWWGRSWLLRRRDSRGS